MRPRFWHGVLVTAWICAMLTPHAFGRRNDPNITLRFLPQQSIAGAHPDIPPQVLEHPVSLTFAGARPGASAERLGNRTNDDDELFTLVATNDVLEFTEEGLREAVEAWGLPVDPDAPRTLEVRLVRLFVTERIQAVGATHRAEAPTERPPGAIREEDARPTTRVRCASPKCLTGTCSPMGDCPPASVVDRMRTARGCRGVTGQRVTVRPARRAYPTAAANCAYRSPGSGCSSRHTIPIGRSPAWRT